MQEIFSEKQWKNLLQSKMQSHKAWKMIREEWKARSDFISRTLIM